MDTFIHRRLSGSSDVFVWTPPGQTVGYSGATGGERSGLKAETSALQNAGACMAEMGHIYIYADGSAEDAVRDGGSGVFVGTPPKQTVGYSVATGGVLGSKSGNLSTPECSSLHGRDGATEDCHLQTLKQPSSPSPPIPLTGQSTNC